MVHLVYVVTICIFPTKYIEQNSSCPIIYQTMQVCDEKLYHSVKG